MAYRLAYNHSVALPPTVLFGMVASAGSSNGLPYEARCGRSNDDNVAVPILIDILIG